MPKAGRLDRAHPGGVQANLKTMDSATIKGISRMPEAGAIGIPQVGAVRAAWELDQMYGKIKALEAVSRSTQEWNPEAVL
jgi:purine nucleoside permease